MWKTLAPLLLENVAGALVRVVGFGFLFVVLGAAVAALAVVVANKRGFLSDLRWPRRAAFALWIVAVPALVGVCGVFVGAGRAAAHIVEENHLTEKVAGAAVHGVVDVVFADARAAALLDEGRFPIEKTAKLFELLPETLSAAAVARVDDAVSARAGDGVVAAVAVRIAKLGVGVVAVSSSLARAAWAAPVLAALQQTDDGDGVASVVELGNAVVRVHVEPRVGHAVDGAVSSQGLPFLLGALAVLLLPVIVERVARAVAAQKQKQKQATTTTTTT